MNIITTKIILFKQIQKTVQERKVILQKHGRDSKEYKESEEKLKTLQKEYRESSDMDECDFT